MIAQKIVYDLSQTTYVNNIEPKYGSVEGGTEITITGSTFYTSISEVIVLIDGINCDVTSVDTNEIVCMTRPRLG